MVVVGIFTFVVGFIIWRWRNRPWSTPDLKRGFHARCAPSRR